MPIYEYECQSCHDRLEKLQKVSDRPLVQCPVCGKDELARVVSLTSFRLKGTGWYETDFKAKPKTETTTKTNDSKSSDSASSAD